MSQTGYSNFFQQVIVKQNFIKSFIMILKSSSFDVHKSSIFYVFAAGVLWSTVGLGIRIIEDAGVWQILLYRSISMSLFLYVVIRFRSKESPFTQVKRNGFPSIVAGLALVAAYSGGIYSIQKTILQLLKLYLITLS